MGFRKERERLESDEKCAKQTDYVKNPTIATRSYDLQINE